jgi:hypothetical protein
MDFYLVRNKHIFSKNHFILEKKRFIFKFCEYVLINELYKNNTFNGKKSFGINALLLPYYKKTFWGLKQIQRKWTFKFLNSCRFLVHLTMHLPSYVYNKFANAPHEEFLDFGPQNNELI